MGVCARSRLQSGSRSSTRASVSETASPANRYRACVLSTAAASTLVWLSLVVAWIVAGLLRRMLLSDLAFDAGRAIESVLTGVMGVLIVVAACRLLDRRSLASLGLGHSRADLEALLAGAGLWLGLAAVGMAVGAITGTFTVMFGPPTWTMAGWILFHLFLVFTGEALPEELALRGYLYTNLAERLPRWAAVLSQAVLFMLWAFALVALLQVLGGRTGWTISLDRAILFLTFGTTLALVRLWTGSLWGSVGFHLAFQTVMGLLGLDRLGVVRVPAEDYGSMGVMLWFFAIVLGGIVASAALFRQKGQASS